MGFLDRVEADNAAAMQEELDETIEQTRRDDEIAAERGKIVDARVRAFAESFGEPVQLAGESGGSRYYLVGDIVLVVRLFGYTPRDQLTETDPKKVIWQYSVAVVGIDRTDRVAEIGRASLSLLNYENIRKAITSHQDLEYRNEHVLSALNLEIPTL